MSAEEALPIWDWGCAGPTLMTIAEASAAIDELDEDDVIFARHPWSGAAEARIVPSDPDPAMRAELEASGFAYFLEIPVAREVFEVFGDKPPTAAEKLRLLLHYAENDAFPDWVYER